MNPAFRKIESFGMLVFVFLLFSNRAASQSALDTPASLAVSEATVAQALIQLGKNCGVELAFSDRFFDKKQKITLREDGKPVREILTKILSETGVGFRELDGQVVLYLLPKEVRRFTVSGFVEDAETGERLILAAVFCPEIGQGTVTNEYGFYSLTLPETAPGITVSYIGYNEAQSVFSKKENHHLNLGLQPALTLAEIIVTPTEKPGDLLPSPASLRRLTPEDFKTAPDLGGQSDLFRTFQMLPGVQTGADGVGGMHIRGGNADQNLVLLDGVPVYNPEHLMGIMSVFNTSAIRSASLLKGGFPARYGGRISSVLDVRTREGNQKNWSGEAGSDFISGKATLEGPFGNGQGAVMLSGRRTHSDFFLMPAALKLLQAEDLLEPRLRFYDLNAKANFAFSEKNKIYLSLYKGMDSFSGKEKFSETDENGTYKAESDATLEWGNTIASLRWNHLFGQNLFSNTTLTYSHFQYTLGLLDKESQEFADMQEPGYYNASFLGLKSDIRDVALKTDFDYTPGPDHYLRFGGGVNRHQFRPNLTSLQEEIKDGDELDGLTIEGYFGEDQIETAIELDAYVEDEFRLGKKWLFNLGLRLSGLLSEDDEFLTPEPRLSLAYLPHDRWKITASLSRTAQYLHRINTFSGIYLPTDYWVPANASRPPQRAWQGTLGLEGKLPGEVEFSLEGYFKRMDNLLALRDSFFFDPFGSDDPAGEEYFTSGDGRSYGFELLVRREIGKTGGWLGYALSKTSRRFDGQNGGLRFPFEYDRRHELKLFLFHRIGDRWQASLNWVYGSANPLSIADSEPAPSPPGQKNATRSTAYHRLDLGVSFSMKTGRLEHTLKASIYNLYGRKNIAFYLPDVNGKADPVFLFGAMPGVHYGLRF